MDLHINDWDVHIALGQYILCAIVFAVSIRALMSFLNAVELFLLKRTSSPEENFWHVFGRYLLGFHPSDRIVGCDFVRSDFWLPTFLGFLELLSYPILLQTGLWSVIGAWIGFKTIAQWNVWTRSRSQFNRYLMGNALVVMLSGLFLVKYVYRYL